MSDIQIVVAGAAGRMGGTVIRVLADMAGCKLSGALESHGKPDLGQDVGVLAGTRALGVALTDDPLPLLAKAHALIDFSEPKVSVELAALSAQARIVHVIGTTGL